MQQEVHGPSVCSKPVHSKATDAGLHYQVIRGWGSDPTARTARPAFATPEAITSWPYVGRGS